MPSKRGRVYCCDVSRCVWKGEKFQAADHYYKHHSTAEDAPFVCTLCQEPFGTNTAMQRHKGQKKHQMRLLSCSSSDDKVLVSRSNYKDHSDYFTVLSQAKSDEVWSSRRTGSDLREALNSLGQSGSEDLLSRAMHEAGLSPVTSSVSPIKTPKTTM